MEIWESKDYKTFSSKDYNYSFDKKTGFFARWGKTIKDDPTYAPAPEIADIEITTICHGVDGKLCPFCYKSNSPKGQNMSFETFKKMIDKFPKYKQETNKIQLENKGEFTILDENTPIETITDIRKFKDINVGDFLAWPGNESYKVLSKRTDKKEIHFTSQVAFGVDSKAESNPDLWKMMEYCREIGIIPNITVAQISDKVADKLVKYCGAVAVSRYENKDICYDSVKKLTDRGLDQTNVHAMIAEETFDNAWETLNDRLTDPRLEKLKAIVFLSLKQKGRGINFTPLSQEKFKKMVDFSMENDVGIGFDSCSCFKYLQSIKNDPNYEKFAMYSEPCESGRMSIYVDVNAMVYPCSFCEKCKGSDKKNNNTAFNWEKGLDVCSCENFVKEIWNNPKIKAWRKEVIQTGDGNINKIQCPMFYI